MSKRDLESLSSLIARLEDWHNRDSVKKAAQSLNSVRDGLGDVISAKSKLLQALARLENAR